MMPLNYNNYWFCALNQSALSSMISKPFAVHVKIIAFFLTHTHIYMYNIHLNRGFIWRIDGM